jgi:hypothetical protein
VEELGRGRVVLLGARDGLRPGSVKLVERGLSGLLVWEGQLLDQHVAAARIRDDPGRAGGERG